MNQIIKLKIKIIKTIFINFIIQFLNSKCFFIIIMSQQVFMHYFSFNENINKNNFFQIKYKLN